ncbi:hypothetical protein KIH87_10550 [Paraneptunicella aestuarii]|uniref:ankyrin repeat domain-containing protein n=1 Tax=Paraneptunicella aestuarii TaxID=2831148 RepID=UPI001E467F6C|nr:ankyrin repeat domain-containing protein [Paraneptunicella aestuarii]UAA37188.1 hypothetical protein KIH87_10550 [Paraneptunicella aestuarii]
MVKPGHALVASVLLSSSMFLYADDVVAAGNTFTSSTQSILAEAVTSGDHLKLSKLLEQGAKTDGEQGLTLLKLALEHNDNKAAELILEAGLDLASHRDDSLLDTAISQNNVKMFETLLEGGAIVDEKNISQLLKKAHSSQNPRFKTLIEAANSVND